ncbi:MAG: hypothetical protein H6742_01485 [Alphaproteobacteria bacterium]|nr:hypothetical protein [Alphaproteobacteria bacterium]
MEARRRRDGRESGRIPSTRSSQGAELLARALGLGEGAVVAMPGDGGDDALDLLALGAAEVHLADPHPGSRALATLKLSASRTLPLWNVQSLLGLDAFGRRVFLYHYVRDGRQEGRGPAPPGLPADAARWLDAHEQYVRTGLLASGAVQVAATGLRRDLARLGLTDRLEAILRAERPLDGLRLRLLVQRWSKALDPTAPTGALLSRWRDLARGPSGGLRQILLDRPLPRPWLTEPGQAVLQDRTRRLVLLDRELPETGAPLDAVLALGPPPAAASRRLRPGGRLVVRAWTRPDPGQRFRPCPALEAEVHTLDPAPLGGPLWIWERD